MRMGIVTAVLCIHMLLWAACNTTPSAHKLGSDEILLREAQPINVFWRKLLQENTLKPDVIKVETTDASVETESNSVDAKDAHTQNEDVKENVALDETPKTDSASSVAQQEEVKGESVGAVTSTQNNVTKEEEPKIQEAPKEDVSSEPTDSGNPTTETKKIENTEDSTSESTTQSQDVKVEESPTLSTNEDDAKVSEKGAEAEENAQLQNVKEEDSGQAEEKQTLVKEETPGEKTDVEENKNASNVDTQLEDVKQEDSAVTVVEEDKHDSTPEQTDMTPGDVKTLDGDQHEALTEETNSVLKGTETTEEPTEDNPIKIVETVSNEKQTDLNNDANIKKVQSSESEGDEKERIALDSSVSVEEQNSSNSTDDSNGETSNSSDIKVDDEKIEEKHESSNDNTEITDKKGGEYNTTEEVSQVKIDEMGEEKHESSDDNTEPKDEESENKGTEEVSQVKSAEKAEENHEPNEEVKDKEGEGNDTEEVSQVKTDDETQAAAKEVESQLEALKRDTVFETGNDQGQERDPSDDEYDIIQEITDLPTKLQETAEKVADHLRPDLLRWSDTSKEYFNLANQQISESFSPLIGRQYAPFFASMISYGILLLPLIVVILLFEHIKALFSLQKVLLFINIYLAAYFATLWLASFIIGLEPMSFFYHNSLSSYLSLQLLQALGYIVYLILQTANIINSCTSDTRVGKVTSCLQWVVALGIGLHYYVTVFHPAVASKPPHTSWKFYAIYSAAFFILCLFARIRWVKKQYVSSENDMTNKKS